MRKREIVQLDNYNRDVDGDLLCFRLVFASPEAKAMTAPKANKDENGVVLEGGETGSNENTLKKASNIQAEA